MKVQFLVGLLTALLMLEPAKGVASEYTEISDHFAIKSVSQSLFSASGNEIFARKHKSGKFKLIGTTRSTHWDKPFSGAALEALQESLVAVSLDGKSLLYWHNDRGSMFGSSKEDGVYWYHIGKGETLVQAESQLSQFWHKYNKPVPKNIMVIKSSNWHTEEYAALSADDASLMPLGLYGGTPLHMAVYENNMDQVRTAIERGVDIDQPTYWSYTALDLAIKKGFDDIAVYLIEQGADYSGGKSQKPKGAWALIGIDPLMLKKLTHPPFHSIFCSAFCPTSKDFGF